MAELTRRRYFLGLAAAFGAGAAAGMLGYRTWEQFAGPSLPFRDVVQDVVPGSGFETPVTFGETIQRLIEAGVLEPDKFRAVYRKRGGVPAWVERLLAAPSDEPIVLSVESAPYLLNLLWPIGLATKAAFNDKSPINNLRLPNYASTAAWTLGRAANGAPYFNSVDTVSWTAERESVALEAAQSSFRPCCNNSTFLQDCNHGSALLGLIELAAAQDIDKAELEKTALLANSYWFSRQYMKTALYLLIYERRSWDEVPPSEILAAKFSSASGWERNVNMAVRLTDFVPRSSLVLMDQGTCGL